MSEPFDSLDDTDWSRITGALGPTTDLPGYLRQLMSEDRDVCSAAIEAVSERIMSDGNVYEATAYVVPFLVHVALHRPEYRAEYVDWMASLCRPGHSTDGYHGNDRLRVHREIARQLPRLIEFIRDPDVKLRRATLLYTACCPATDVDAVIDLRTLTDESPLVRADRLIVLALLQPQWSALEDHLVASLSDPAPVVRYQAARILTRIQEEGISERAVDVLADSIAEIGLPLTEFQQVDTVLGVPELTGEAVAVAALTRLGQLGDPLVQYPDKALRAARRIATARTEHSDYGVELAGQVVEVWRDREAQAAGVVASHLAGVSDPRRQHALLQRLARLAVRIGDPDPVLFAVARERVQAPEGLVSGAAIAVLARLGDSTALERAQRASDQWNSWQPWMHSDMCDVFGDQAGFLLAVVRRWLDVFATRADGRGDATSLFTAVSRLGTVGYQAVPELIALLQRDLFVSGVCHALGRMGAAGAEAAQALEASARRGLQASRLASAAAHFAITGDDALARTVVGLVAAENRLDRWSIEPLGLLGPVARECVPLLEGLLDDRSAYSRADAAHALWRITGDVDRCVPVLAEIIGPSPAVLHAVDALLEIGVRPDSCVERLQLLARSPYRQLGGARVDPARPDDDMLRDHALSLLVKSSY